MSEPFQIREATAADIKIVMHHRRTMFCDMGYGDEAALAAMAQTSKPYFLRGLENGSYRGWLIEDEAGKVIAGGGVIITDYHSSPMDPLPKRAIAVNVYTEPEYRRRGLARKLMKIMIEWCREHGLGTMLLHASDDGRVLYESLGFEQTNEMRLRLK
jgi:GNAT superfamily N-acetyltransferase